MVELGIVGAKNSGKTTVIEKLVRHLVNEGLSVATVKHTAHSHRFDTPGKDSFRHREAGAGLTVAISDDEVAVFARPDTIACDGIQKLTEGQFDIWLIEGDRQADRPKVMVTRKLKDLPLPAPANIVATIGPERIESVPVHFDTNDTAGLCSFVTKSFLDRSNGGQK